MADIFGSFNQGFTAGRQIRDDRMKRNALLEAGQAFQGGDYKTAGNALFAYDPGAAMKIQEYGMRLERQQKADELAGQQRERDKTMAGLKAFAQAAQGLKLVPLEGRFQAAQQIIPQLAAGLGADSASILKNLTPEKLTDDQLDAFSAMMMDPEGYAKLQQQLAEPQKLGPGDILTDARGTVLQRNPRPAQVAAGGGGGGVAPAPAQAAGGPTPMPEYGPNAFKLANGSIVEIYKDKQGQPRIGKTLLTGPGGGNPDVVRQTYKQQFATQSIVADSISRAKELAKKGTVGFGSMLSGVPSTSSYDLAKTLDTIKANLGFDKLQAMRAASPTGGALGSVTERELALLQAVFGSLDQGQSREQFIANLDRLQAQYAKSMAAIAAAYEQDFGRPIDGDASITPVGPDASPAPVEDPLGIR